MPSARSLQRTCVLILCLTLLLSVLEARQRTYVRRVEGEGRIATVAYRC
jgi:hypothetical protein